MEIHLFGAATPVGEFIRRSLQSGTSGCNVFCYSRSASRGSCESHYIDLRDPASFFSAGESRSPKTWISFAPIWLLAPFLELLASDYPERLEGLRGLIACSSSSAITKRFAVNHFDRELAVRLNNAEQLLLATCLRLHIPCRILQPTVIYGRIGAYSDRNLSFLLQQLRRLPVLPLPAQTGLRQPIHASQLAAVALHLAQQLAGSGWDACLPERIALGGDNALTYAEMICALQQAQLPSDPAHRCRLLPIPNRLFFLLAAPLLLRSPKSFEAVLRMGANLSGFIPSHQLLGCKPQPFPVLPLA